MLKNEERIELILDNCVHVPLDLRNEEIKEFKSFIKTVREGECWPAVPTIAREIQLSEQTERRAILDLCKAKIVETEQRYRTKGGKSSLLSNCLKKKTTNHQGGRMPSWCPVVPDMVTSLVNYTLE